MTPALENPPIGRRIAVPPPKAPAEATPPMVEAQFLLVRQALAARQPIRSAARTARRSAVTTLVIGAGSVPVAVLFPSWLGIVVALGICTIGAIEYAGARRMQRGLPSAAAFLARNQLAFLGLIVAYCVLQMVSASSPAAGSAIISDELQSQLSQVPGFGGDFTQQIKAAVPLVSYAFYTLVILLSAGFQGGLALFYFTRKKHLEALERSTPPWVLRLFAELEA
jgi:hypothetical protein